MSNYAGTSTIYRNILPNNSYLSKINYVKLTKQAKHRLAIIEHYLNKTGNVSLTCRHFAISRSYFYKWYKRYNPKYLKSLENISTRPKNIRQATYSYSLVKLVHKLRKDYPSYSSKKIAVILRRDWSIYSSHSTIGRIIKKFNLYFRAKIIASKKRSKKAIQVWKLRKPYSLRAKGPNKVIEFDMKHIYTNGQKHYAFVAVDIFTKQATIHLAKQPSSYQAMIALQATISVFGDDVCIVNDNGSENHKHAYSYLKTQNIKQYFARPHRPKDKPHVENLIGKLQQECLDEDKTTKTLDERRIQVNRWLNDYHYFRPHQALNYKTPEEYCAKLNITIPRAKVSTM
jgi:transposase InsO family protein/transposase-like protein